MSVVPQNMCSPATRLNTSMNHDGHGLGIRMDRRLLAAQKSLPVFVMEEAPDFPEVIVALLAEFGIGGMSRDKIRNIVPLVRD